MQTTEHGLKKPASDDFYNIEDFNSNTDVLEEHLDDDETHVNVGFIVNATEATTLEQIASTDTTSKVWGKIKKAIATLISHVSFAATASTLGHIKIGTGLQSTSGTASVKLTDSVTSDDSTTALTAKGAKALNEAKAPNSHASTATTYGVGNATNYGHIKLSDTYKTNAGGASAALGASQAALYGAYNELNTNLGNRTLRAHSNTSGNVVTKDTYINTDTEIIAVSFTAGISSMVDTGNLYVAINKLSGSYDSVLENVGAGISSTVVIEAVRVSSGWLLDIKITSGQGTSSQKTITLSGEEFNTVRLHAGGGIQFRNVSTFYKKYII